jgi:tRNA threonylcarbamoyladenosine biosynthesis protein TsaE
MHYDSASEQDKAALAARLAPYLRAGDLVCLKGTLGMGKSVFARALIRALAANPGLDVPSPTFTLVQTYEAGGASVWHFDLYRLENPEEIFELGWEDARAEAISIVEWPERLGSFLPADRLDILLSAGDGDQRLIDTIPHGIFQERPLA